MADVTPGGGDRLKAYWATGPGAAKVRWNTPGDFDRCVRLVQEAVVKGGSKPLGDYVLKGFCASLHKRVTGFAPGKAPGDKVGG